MAIVTLLTPRENEIDDFQLPPGGGLVEKGLWPESEETGDNGVLLGGVLGGVVSFIVLCAAVVYTRRRRAKVQLEYSVGAHQNWRAPKGLKKKKQEEIEPPKIFVDPMSSEKPVSAIANVEKNSGPRLGAVADIEQHLAQPPRVKKQRRSSDRKAKSLKNESETAIGLSHSKIKESETADCAVETTQVVEIDCPFPASPRRHSHSPEETEQVVQDLAILNQIDCPFPASPRRHSHSPSSKASQRRAREREIRRSRSQIYSTKVTDAQANDIEEVSFAIQFDSPTKQERLVKPTPSALVETEVVKHNSRARESSSSRVERRMAPARPFGSHRIERRMKSLIDE